MLSVPLCRYILLFLATKDLSMVWGKTLLDLFKIEKYDQNYFRAALGDKVHFGPDPDLTVEERLDPTENKFTSQFASSVGTTK
jgi:hypothetical protein